MKEIAHSSFYEYQLPHDIFRSISTNAYVGYWVGSGVGFLQAGISIDTFFSGILLRNAAIGVLTASGMSLLYPAAAWLISIIQRCRDHQNVGYGSQNIHVRQKRLLFRLSVSRFYSCDLRIFLMSQAVAALGAVIAENTGSEEERIFGNLVGRSIGSCVGTFIVLPILSLIRCCVERRTSHENQRIQEIKWYQESHHDVPFYVRLFFGAWLGYIATSVLSFPRDEYGFIDQVALAKNCLIGTLLMSAATLLSPLFFSLWQKILNKFDHEPSLLNNPKFKPVSWYRGTRMDIPWYARLFCAVIAAATIGLVNEKYYQEDQINKSIVYVGSVIALASPFFFALWEKLLKYCWKESYSLENLKEPTPLKLSYDMPWYARAAFATLAGAMLGDALWLATTDASTYEFDSPPSQLPIILMQSTLWFGLFTPMLMAGLQRIGFFHRCFNPTDDLKLDFSWPWYSRLMLGLWLGVLLGTAFENLSRNNDFVIPTFIGPEFLGLSNANGAAAGALIVGTIGLLWPLMQHIGKKMQPLFSALSCYRCFKPENHSHRQTYNYSSLRVTTDPGEEVDITINAG